MSLRAPRLSSHRPDGASSSPDQYQFSGNQSSGSTLDTRLTWSHHIHKIRNRTAQRMGMLGPLMNKKRYLSVRNGVLLYRGSEEEWTKLRESVPYVKLYRYNPKHLYPKLNGYGDNGHRKVWDSGVSTTVRRPCRHTRTLRMPGNETLLANIVMQWPWRDNGTAAACVKYLEN